MNKMILTLTKLQHADDNGKDLTILSETHFIYPVDAVPHVSHCHNDPGSSLLNCLFRTSVHPRFHLHIDTAELRLCCSWT